MEIQTPGNENDENIPAFSEVANGNNLEIHFFYYAKLYLDAQHIIQKNFGDRRDNM